MAKAEDNGAAHRMLSVEDILAAADTPEEGIEVPEWGGAVTIRGLTKRQQQDIRQRATIGGEVDEVRTQQLLWLEGVVSPRFTEEQLGPLFDKNAGAVDRVLKRLLVLSGMDDEAAKRKEATFRP